MLSVIVITKDEQDRIKACLESVRQLADEIIVADNGSTDRTVEIAKHYTNKIIKFTKHDFATLRNKALEQTSGDWLLCVDSDERVLQDLKKEIITLMSTNPSEVAWAIPRRNIILGQEKKYPAFWPDYVIRLFKRAHLKGWLGRVHEQPQFDGSLGKIKSPFLHLTHRDINSMVLKSLDWGSIDAQLRLESGHPPITGLRLIKILLGEIFHQGIIRRGFFNGTVGVIDSLLQAFSFYISYVKLWQLQRPRPLKKIYQEIDEKLIKDGFNY